MDLPEDSSESSDPYATGFVISRRELIHASGTAGLAALAGCGGDRGGTPTASSTPSDTPSATATESEPVGESTVGGLEIVSTDLVASQGLGKYLRVVLRNTFESETMSLVGLTAEFFDPDLQFLEIQSGTVFYLGPGEAFEGYVPYFHDEAAAFAVRADRTRRRETSESLSGLTISGDCIDDEQVRGQVENNGAADVGRLGVRVTFYDAESRRIGAGKDTVTNLGAGQASPFAVDFAAALGDPSARVTDYAVSVGDYGNSLLAVR